MRYAAVPFTFLLGLLAGYITATWVVYRTLGHLIP